MNAYLLYLEILSSDCARLAGFYQKALGMRCERLADGRWLCLGPGRRLILAAGAPKTLGFAAYGFAFEKELIALKNRLAKADVPLAPSPSPLFGHRAFSIRDPDGTCLVFGLADDVRDRVDEPTGLNGRLQHVVMASPNCERVARFYEEVLGFTVSDRVYRDDGSLTTCFLRSDDEHHSFAVFQAPEYRFDHYCHETEGWDAIRDWADRFAAQDIPLQWGPGRHGPGNNLFIFIHDPDGNWVEFSAELERVPSDRPAGRWPHAERTLNLWGRAPLRS